MIILDTNALSALMHQQPNPQVVAWLDDQSAESIWLSSIAFLRSVTDWPCCQQAGAKTCWNNALKNWCKTICKTECCSLIPMPPRARQI